jgi:hypothetical protein
MTCYSNQASPAASKPLGPDALTLTKPKPARAPFIRTDYCDSEANASQFLLKVGTKLSTTKTHVPYSAGPMCSQSDDKLEFEDVKEDFYVELTPRPRPPIQQRRQTRKASNPRKQPR